MRWAKKVSLMFASTPTLGIGQKGGLPWPRVKADMRHFQSVTATAPPGQRNAVIMGANTFDSLDRRPLPNRLNLVVTSRPAKPADDLRFVASLEEARAAVEADERVHRAFVVGGARLLNDFFAQTDVESVDTLYWNRVLGDFKTDVALDKQRFSAFLAKMRSLRSAPIVSETLSDGKHAAVEFLQYSRAPGIAEHAETQYIDLLRELIKAPSRKDRTGVGVREKFGHMFRFDLEHTFPLLTTKRTFFRGVVEELLWFLRGSTDARQLSALGVGIWDDNGSEAFLRARGLPYEPGDLGPVYGFQWRHFGAEYTNCNADYKGKGVDQLRRVIEELRRDPDSRRLIVSAWNPLQIDRMALPPCHVLFQFHVSAGRLNLALYQRSCDVGLGVPFNIASYSLLLCLVADHLGLKRGEFVHFLGSAHIYETHVEALKHQVERVPLPFPRLHVRPRGPKAFIDEYTADELRLEGYLSHDAVKMKMAV